MSPRPKGRPSRSFFRQFPDQVTVVDTLRVESSSLTSRGIGFGVLELVVDLRSAVGKCCVALSINRFECPRQRAVDWPEPRFITVRNTSGVLVSWVSADKYRTILITTVAPTYLILEDSKMVDAMSCTLASYVHLSAAHSNLVLPVVLNLYPTTENSRMADTLPRSSRGPMQRGSEGNIVLWSNGAHRGMPSICIARSNGAPSGMPSCRCRGVMAPVAECLPTVSHTIPSLVKLFDLAANIELVSQQRSLYMLPLGGPPRIIGLYKSSNSRSLTSQVATS